MEKILCLLPLILKIQINCGSSNQETFLVLTIRSRNSIHDITEKCLRTTLRNVRKCRAQCKHWELKDLIYVLNLLLFPPLYFISLSLTRSISGRRRSTDELIFASLIIAHVERMERAALVWRWPAENWRRLTSRICGARRREIYLRRPLILWPAFASHQIIILFLKNLGDLFASARALFICVSLYYCNHASLSSPAFTNP